MFNRLIIISAVHFIGLHVFSQDWLPLGAGVDNHLIYTMIEDAENDRLYIAGNFNSTDSIQSENLGVWNGNDWLNIDFGVSGSAIRAMAFWKKNLVIAGYFSIVSNQNVNGIAILADSNWINLDGGVKNKSGSIWAVVSHQEYLYAFGAFDSIGDIEAPRFARWDGHQWEAFAPPIMNGNYIIYDAVFYKGELYVAGNINHPNKPEFNEIVRWDGQEWKDVGGGVLSGGTVFDLEIYNEELYVGGFLANPADSEERCIARWDGEQWKRVGGGLSPSAVQIQNMHVWDDKLWVSSGPGTAGGLTQNAFLHYWDGTNWCQTKTVDQYAFALGSYRDTLIIGTSKYFDSTHNVQINHIAKLNMADYTDSCSHIATGVEEISDESDFMQLYPNPAVERLFIQLEAIEGEIFEVYDAKGRQIQILQTAGIQNVIELNTSELQSGFYLVKARKSGKTAKFVVQK